jgi:hypothetical protein
MIKKGKHEDQIQRDSIRDALAQNGVAEVIDGSHHITLNDGTKFNIGLDGHSKFTGFDGQAQIANGFEVDHTNPMAPQVIAWLGPLGKIVGGGNDKVGGDFTTWLANAAMSNANGDLEVARENVRNFYRQFQFTNLSDVQKQVANLSVSQEEKAILLNSLNEMLQIVPDSAAPGTENQIQFTAELQGAFDRQNGVATVENPDADAPDPGTLVPGEAEAIEAGQQVGAIPAIAPGTELPTGANIDPGFILTPEQIADLNLPPGTELGTLPGVLPPGTVDVQGLPEGANLQEILASINARQVDGQGAATSPLTNNPLIGALANA